MGDFQHKDMSGSLFKNDKREKDTHPDYRGDGVIDGHAVWISAWVKQGKNGSFFSLSFKRKDFAQKQQGSLGSKGRSDPISTGRQQHDINDDVPF